MTAPHAHILREIGLNTAYGDAYAKVHGSACSIHPFGCKVHEGLLRMAINRGQAPSSVFALWVYYPHQPNKSQVRMPFGVDPRNCYGGKWFPATGTPVAGMDCSWYITCIGQEWLRWPGWYIHESRVKLVNLRLDNEYNLVEDDRVSHASTMSTPSCISTRAGEFEIVGGGSSSGSSQWSGIVIQELEFIS